MTTAQIRGKQLFETKGRCIECHSGPQFTDSGFHNLGVDTVDVGRFAVLPLPSMKFAFKTPGLRDIEYSAPYLHDGSARTLREVVVFYNQGGHADAQGQPNLAIEPLGLTDQEIDDLTAFLKALSGTGVRDYPFPTLP
jgi:cytochrome c peroxidase